MPIVVNCPSCKSKMRAPDNMAGRKAKCPKCGQLVAIPAAVPSTPATTTPISPAEVIQAEPRPQPTLGPASNIPTASSGFAFSNLEEDETPIRRQAHSDYRTKRGAAHSLGIGSMVLGVVALLFSFIPCIGVFSMPLSGLGLLLGIIGGIVALFRSGSGIGFPVAGSAINGMALLIALFWLGLASATHKALDESSKTLTHLSMEANATNQRVEADDKKSHPETASETPTQPRHEDAEWADARKWVRQSDVRIAITSVILDHVPLHSLGDPSLSKDKLLIIRIRIENVGQTRKIEYESWGDTSHLVARHVPNLKDNFDNNYRRASFGFGTHIQDQLSSESIHPGKFVEDVLVFEQPIDRINYLRLELPASAFGGTGKLRIQIPKNMIIDAMQQREQAMRDAEGARQQEAAREQEAALLREQARREAEKERAEENRRQMKLAEEEQHARPLYQRAYQLWFRGHNKQAKEICEEIIRKHPDTKSAARAKELLDKIGK